VNPILRPMTMADIPAGLALCRESGWNQTARDWGLLLTLAPEGAFVAELDGTVAGTVIAVPYHPEFDWVAMMLVQESLRGRGIGRALMDHVLARSSRTVGLDATAAGRLLYATLGFEDEFTLTRWRGVGMTRSLESGTAAPLRDSDWNDIAALDRPSFGADRLTALRWCWKEAPEYAWTTRSGDRLTGFVLGRHGHHSEHIGPLVATSETDASALLDSCLPYSGNGAVTIDVPDSQSAFRQTLEARAFAAHRAFTRMRRGTLRMGQPFRLFASIGPEFG
jgi:GNAT superfamily N-acetyltransferase